MPIKGKKILPRVMRFFDTSRNLTIITLLVACFSQLDVVQNSVILDRLDDSSARKEALAQSDTFVHTEMQYVLPVSAKCSLRIVSGLLGLFLERNNVVAMAQTPVSHIHNAARSVIANAVPLVGWNHHPDGLLESR